MCLLGDLFLSLFSSKATEMNHLSACLVNSPMPSDLLWALSGSFGAAPGLGLTPPPQSRLSWLVILGNIPLLPGPEA